MNQAPSNQGNTFSSQPASQTNPFTADLKGEFTSNFGTNTNAVSQIFKEGGFANSNRTRIYILLGVLLLVAGGAFWYLTSESTNQEVAPTTAEQPSTTESAEESAEDEVTDAAPSTADMATSSATATKPAEPTAASSLTLVSPPNGATVGYDETQGAARFSWQGEGGAIVFSRNSSMRPEVMRVNVKGNSFAFNNPWPGTWYWKVENASGSSEVRSFTVNAPVRRNVALSAPASGATIAGSGGEVSWQGDSGVAFYRVELSSGDWANPQFKFSTSGTRLQLNGVPAGQYKMRLGAFSEVSGRWEYTAPVDVTVQ